MHTFHSDLINSLQTGLIDHTFPSKQEYLPQLLINDNSRGKKVLSTIIRELQDCDEFWFSVAFVTKSGVATLINTFDHLKERNIKGKVVVSQYQNFTEPEALRQLLKQPNIELRISTEGSFHAKGYLFRKLNKYNLIIGSSNLTANALTTNKEWNLKISSTDNGTLITETIKEFTNEFDKAVIVNIKFIDEYEVIYKAQNRIFKSHEIILQGLQKILPNSMQSQALENLQALRNRGAERALLISATGTGKTYLSAFDVKALIQESFCSLYTEQTLLMRL
jgi:HKD family nuclease